MSKKIYFLIRLSDKLLDCSFKQRSHLSSVCLSLHQTFDSLYFCLSLSYHLSVSVCLCSVHQYLQYCSSYSAQSADMFYPRPSSQRCSSRQREVETTYQLPHLDTLLETNVDTHEDTHSPDSSPTPELFHAPFLPPKKKQQVNQRYTHR